MNLRFAAATLALATLAALPRAEACEVVAAPALAERMTAWLQAHPAEQADCLQMVVLTETEGETLLLTTRDGRTARRTIEAEAELEETIEALLLAPPPPPRAVVAAQPEPKPEPPSPPPPATRSDGPAASPSALHDHHLFASTGLVWHPEPGIGLYAVETGWSWQAPAASVEFGARWAPAITPGGTPMAGFAATSSDLWLAAGVPLGRRPGRRLDGALRLGWQTFAETADNPVATKKNDLDLSGEQWLAGGALVMHRPLAPHLGLRTSLNADISLTGLRAKGATSKGLPALPGFGLGLLVGVEVAP